MSLYKLIANAFHQHIGFIFGNYGQVESRNRLEFFLIHVYYGLPQCLKKKYFFTNPRKFTRNFRSPYCVLSAVAKLPRDWSRLTCIYNGEVMLTAAGLLDTRTSSHFHSSFNVSKHSTSLILSIQIFKKKHLDRNFYTFDVHGIFFVLFLIFAVFTTL